jgi:hypothetical protein
MNNKWVPGILLSLHFLFVMINILPRTVAGIKNAGVLDGINTYMNVAGLYRGYGYFAPAVGSDVRVAFVLTDSTGRRSFVDLSSSGREVSLHYDCMIRESMRMPSVRDAFTRSWAAYIFDQYPHTAVVTVLAETLTIPPMAQFAHGARQTWDIIYVANFSKS